MTETAATTRIFAFTTPRAFSAKLTLHLLNTLRYSHRGGVHEIDTDDRFQPLPCSLACGGVWGEVAS